MEREMPEPETNWRPTMETRDICPHGFDFTNGNAEVFCPDCCLRPGEFVYCEACAERDIHTDIPGTRNDPTYTFVCPVCGHVQTYTPQFPPSVA